MAELDRGLWGRGRRRPVTEKPGRPLTRSAPGLNEFTHLHPDARLHRCAGDLLYEGQAKGDPGAWVGRSAVLQGPPGSAAEALGPNRLGLDIAPRPRPAPPRWPGTPVYALTLARRLPHRLRGWRRSWPGAASTSPTSSRRTCALLRRTARPPPGCFYKRGRRHRPHPGGRGAGTRPPDQWPHRPPALDRGVLFSGRWAVDPEGRSASRQPVSWSATRKQSIYSFQGAQPGAVDPRVRVSHRDRAVGAGFRLRAGWTLLASWAARRRRCCRSWTRWFRPAGAGRRHPAHARDLEAHPPPADPHRSRPACVDVWPLEKEPEAPERLGLGTRRSTPVAENSANRTLAKKNRRRDRRPDRPWGQRLRTRR